MDSDNIQKSSALIGNLYANQALASHNTFSSLITQLITQKQLPKHPMPDNLIEHLLYELSLMDTNNFSQRAGVGEREGRIFSPIVQKRNFYMSHGIGRSGDLFSVQPKAAGSSLILKLTNALAKHALKLSNLPKLHCVVVPLATGMSLTLAMLTLKTTRVSAKYVIWSRIDQKTCLKCIFSANLTPIVLETVLEGETVSMGDLDAMLEGRDANEILCVLTTTSCFAPRRPDYVEKVAAACLRHGIPHVVNNAYGLQCSKISHSIKEAARTGRVDFIVQSTDKNFMVPVGGAIIASPNKSLIDQISQIYPGRASISPILDLFITFLSMGESGYIKLLNDRKEISEEFKKRLKETAEKCGERMIEVKGNTISFAISCNDEELGSKLFLRRVSGCRFISNKAKEVCGIRFGCYGSSYSNYPTSYLTAACAIGLTHPELDLFFRRLEEVLHKS